MSEEQSQLRDFFKRSEYVYIDANEIFGYGKYLYKRGKKKFRKKKVREPGILNALADRFVLIISELGKFEFYKEMVRTFKIRLKTAEKYYETIREKFRVLEASEIIKEEIPINKALLDTCLKADMDLIDGIHLIYASMMCVKIITEDKKMHNKKMYSEVYYALEILKKKKL